MLYALFGFKTIEETDSVQRECLSVCSYKGYFTQQGILLSNLYEQPQSFWDEFFR